jgi:rhodanese-related sulfurtransferase
MLLSLPIAAALAEEMVQIAPDALFQRLEKKDAGVVVVDVRTPEEYAAGHVPGAVNVPYTDLPARISELTGAADKDIVLYCVSGRRAGIAAARLKEHGFTRLLHLQGDIRGWQEKNLPVEK